MTPNHLVFPAFFLLRRGHDRRHHPVHSRIDALQSRRAGIGFNLRVSTGPRRPDRAVVAPARDIRRLPLGDLPQLFLAHRNVPDPPGVVGGLPKILHHSQPAQNLPRPRRGVSLFDSHRLLRRTNAALTLAPKVGAVQFNFAPARRDQHLHGAAALVPYGRGSGHRGKKPPVKQTAGGRSGGVSSHQNNRR